MAALATMASQTGPAMSTLDPETFAASITEESFVDARHDHRHPALASADGVNLIEADRIVEPLQRDRATIGEAERFTDCQLLHGS